MSHPKNNYQVQDNIMILKIMIGIKEHIIFYSLRFEIKNIYIIILIFIFNINIIFYN